MKLPAVPVPDMSGLTKEQLKEEIEKGFANAAAGRVMPAASVFAELREKDLPQTQNLFHRETNLQTNNDQPETCLTVRQVSFFHGGVMRERNHFDRAWMLELFSDQFSLDSNLLLYDLISRYAPEENRNSLLCHLTTDGLAKRLSSRMVAENTFSGVGLLE